MLRGTLATTSLADVLRLLCGSGQSGRLIVGGDDEEAQISVLYGRIIDASAREVVGVEALREICSRRDSTFVFRADPSPTSRRSLEDYPTHDIIESIRRAIEYDREMARAIPSLDDTLVFRTDRAQEIAASPEELQALVLADGTRTVGEIVSETGLPADYVRSTFARQRVAGLLDIKPVLEPTTTVPVESRAEQTSSDSPESQRPTAERFWRGKKLK